MADEAGLNIYRCTPRQTYRLIKRVWESGLVPMVQSSPGMGKSSLFRKAANEFNLHLIDHRASTSAPEDFTGLPEFRTIGEGIHQRRIATFTPFDLFPIEETPLPEGRDGWALFMDEFNSAEKEIQAASYKLMLDKMVGQHRLHPRVVIGGAGNLSTDKAITTDLSTAMQSRLIHIEMELSHKEWYEDVALAENYDDRIIAYNFYDPDALMDFKPDHQDKTFCCPRTWEFMNKLVTFPDGKPRPVVSEDTSLFAGTITSGHAASFVTFCEVYKELVTIEEVLRDPDGALVPGRDEQGRKWAIVTHLMKKVNDKNFTDVATYVNRLDMTFKVMFFRSVVHQHPKFRSHPAFVKAMIDLNRYLKDDGDYVRAS